MSQMLFDLELLSFNTVIVNISVIFPRCCSCFNNFIQHLYARWAIESAAVFLSVFQSFMLFRISSFFL
jgi:hypothetical protein